MPVVPPITCSELPLNPHDGQFAHVTDFDGSVGWGFPVARGDGGGSNSLLVCYSANATMWLIVTANADQS